MGFSPFDLSVKQILTGDNRYKIPNFQRGFSWNKTNFDDFYNDLIISSKIDIKDVKVDSNNKYFFGTILLLGNKLTPDVDKPYEVIDGQQRLTTVTLFFAAIIDIIKSINKDYKTEFNERLFFDSIKEGQSTQIQRLVNDALDPILPISILNINKLKDDGAEPIPDSYEQNWLIESYDYIKTLLCKDNISISLNNSENIDDEKYISILDNIGKHLSNAVMICIYHENRDEANNLFRNLNYRGKPLSQSDLIKNELFAVISETGDFVSKTWKNIEDNIYDSGETMQQFIYHYMYSRYTQITNNNAFEKFLKNVKSERKAYVDFLKSLRKSSEYYRIILSPNDSDTIFGIKDYFKKDDNPSIKRTLEFFRKIEVSQLRILLLSLFVVREKNIINNTRFREFFNQISLHQSVHVLVKSSPNKLTSIYAKASRSLLNLVTKDKSEYKEESKKILDTLKEDLKDRKPELVVVGDVDLEYSGKPEASMKPAEKKEHALIRFILQKISEDVQDKATVKSNDGLGFISLATIEHIIDKRDRSEGLLSIGNLILLERDVREDLEDFKLKKEMYDKSKISLTKNFFLDYPYFGIEDIETRRRNILESFYNLIYK